MACTDIQTIQAGNGNKKSFTFNFPYIFKSEIHVYFWNADTKKYEEKLQSDATYPWKISDSNGSVVEFTKTPPPPRAPVTKPNETQVDNVKISRITNTDDIRALFNPGAAIRSDDLNKNFEQLRFALQEANCHEISETLHKYLKDHYWDRFDNTLYQGDTWVASDAKIATTAAMDQRFQDEIEERLTQAELEAVSNNMPADDNAVPTTGAVKDYVDHVVENDIQVNASSGLEKSADGGVVTIGIAADSVDLDRIKSEDIKSSSDTNYNTNDDFSIATTQRIEDMIDAAITTDITSTDGVSITSDSAGTIRLGLDDSGVDLSKINDEDKITTAEQNSAAVAPDDSSSVSPTDDNIFTASAAARRFDTIVSRTRPTSTNWQVGKTWLQNDDDSTLSIWNGKGWTTVSQGGGFRTQDKVIYVDKAGGDDRNTGHRISTPKATISGAIADINADIKISTDVDDGFDPGNGYENGVHTNVTLVHGTTGANLTATLTVQDGKVTDVADVDQELLQEYQIGDELHLEDAALGGSGSDFALPVVGSGDGMTVIVAAGVYQEPAPIQIKRRDVSIIGMALRSTIVHPTKETEKPSEAGNNALFELNSGSFIQNLTLTGMQASAYVESNPNILDDDLPDKQGWNFAFYGGCYITKSPYIQNCTNFSDSEIDNDDLRAHSPGGGSAGDTSSSPTGGGMLVDGAIPKTNSPLRSMVADSYTHVGLNGPGILVTNNGYTQCTSSYAFFNKYHIKCRHGGQANLAASTSDFGERSLVADGRSSEPIFTSTVDGLHVGEVKDQEGKVTQAGDKQIAIHKTERTDKWFGTSTRPAENMLIKLGDTLFPILGATERSPGNPEDGYLVEISNPNPDRRSDNRGLLADLDDGSVVKFFLRSQIASSGHTMEYVGAGTNYSALPENGGVPDDTMQITELHHGKVWTATTDHNGKFKVGGSQSEDPIFAVDQQLGFVSIPNNSVEFKLLTDQDPQLSAKMNARSFPIENLPNPEKANDAVRKAYVDAKVNNLAPKKYLTLLATKENPVFSGTPMIGEDAIATETYVDAAVEPLATKENPIFSGTPKIGANLIATQNYVTTAIGPYATTASVNTKVDLLAPKENPNFTGTPKIGGKAIPTIDDVQPFDADTAKTDVVQQFTKAQRVKAFDVPVEAGGKITINFDESNNFFIKLTDHVTTITVENSDKDGTSGSIFIAQPKDGDSIFTVEGWGPEFRFHAGESPTITPAVNKIDRIDYIIVKDLFDKTRVQAIWSGDY